MYLFFQAFVACMILCELVHPATFHTLTHDVWLKVRVMLA